MKESPLLFIAPMVRATLADNKTITRREIIRLGGFGKITQFGRSDTPGYDWHFRDSAMRWNDLTHAQLMKACPYGQPGDRLWVRETWQAWHRTSYEYDEWEPISVKEATAAMKDQNCVFGPTCDSIQYRATSKSVGPWTPSIHMPRWACRILLEVTGVRVERLQDISEADCWAEGIEEVDGFLDDMKIIELAKRMGRCIDDAAPTFAALWESIGGDGSWDANPWVWVIEFKRHVA